MNKDPALKCSVLVYHHPHTLRRKPLCWNSKFSFRLQNNFYFVFGLEKIFIFFIFFVVVLWGQKKEERMLNMRPDDREDHDDGLYKYPEE